MVGKSKAIELMATGELFDFERGRELGIINNIYEAETAKTFMEKVMDYARNSPRLIGRRKRSRSNQAQRSDRR